MNNVPPFSPTILKAETVNPTPKKKDISPTTTNIPKLELKQSVRTPVITPIINYPDPLESLYKL